MPTSALLFVPPAGVPRGGLLQIRGAKARGHSAECPCLRLRAFRAKPGPPADRWPAGERTSKEAGEVFAISGGNGVLRSLRGRLPPGCPPPLSEGDFCTVLWVAFPCAEYFDADALKSCFPGGLLPIRGAAASSSQTSVRSVRLFGEHPLPFVARPPPTETVVSVGKGAAVE